MLQFPPTLERSAFVGFLAVLVVELDHDRNVAQGKFMGHAPAFGRFDDLNQAGFNPAGEGAGGELVALGRLGEGNGLAFQFRGKACFKLVVSSYWIPILLV